MRRRLFEAHWHAAYAHYLSGQHAVARRLFLGAWRWQPWRAHAILAAGLLGPVGQRLLRAVRRARRGGRS